MTTHSEEDTIKGLRNRAPGDVLTADEVEALQRIVRVYQGFRALGWLGSSVRNILIVVGTVIAAYGALTGALAEWIKKLAGAG